jgi:hypothetical protein
VLLYALQKYWRGVDHWTKVCDFEQGILDAKVSAAVHPGGDEDRRPAHPRPAVEQYPAATDVLCDGAHHRLELEKEDWAGIVNRDADILDVGAAGV